MWQPIYYKASSLFVIIHSWTIALVIIILVIIDPLECKGNYSATSNNMKLVHWPLTGGLLACYIWYSEEGTGRGHSAPRPLLAVRNVTTHLPTASVPITVLL